MLLDHGADHEMLNYENETALMIATTCHNPFLEHIFLDRGADAEPYSDLKWWYAREYTLTPSTKLLLMVLQISFRCYLIIELPLMPQMSTTKHRFGWQWTTVTKKSRDLKLQRHEGIPKQMHHFYIGAVNLGKAVQGGGPINVHFLLKHRPKEDLAQQSLGIMLCRTAATHNEACARLLRARHADGNTVHRDQNALEDCSSQNPSEFSAHYNAPGTWN